MKLNDLGLYVSAALKYGLWHSYEDSFTEITISTHHALIYKLL